MKNILITRVSTGIGYTTCAFFLDKGFRVFGTVRSEDDAEKLRSEFNGNFETLIFDVTDQPAIERAANRLKEILKGEYLYALINNAGVAVYGPILYLSTEQFRHQFEVNYFGVINVIKAFSPFLFSRKTPGRIINISSVSGMVSSPFLAPYCSSKFALESLSDSLRREMIIFNVKVVVIEPGPIKTPIWKKAEMDDHDYTDTPFRDVFKLKDQMLKMSRKQAIEPEKVARTIYKACTKKNPKTRYIVAKNPFRVWLMSRIVPDKMLDRLYMKAFKKQKFRP